eukprot:5436273-Pleurochrysis_carterae.AAC.1
MARLEVGELVQKHLLWSKAQESWQPFLIRNTLRRKNSGSWGTTSLSFIGPRAFPNVKPGRRKILLAGCGAAPHDVVHRTAPVSNA